MALSPATFTASPAPTRSLVAFRSAVVSMHWYCAFFASCLPEILITVENVAIVDRHDLVATDSDCGLLHYRAADILDQCSIGVGRAQRDRESQPRAPWDYDVAPPQIRKPHEQMLVLVNGRWIVYYNHRLPHSLHPPGGSEGGGMGLAYFRTRLKPWY